MKAAAALSFFPYLEAVRQQDKWEAANISWAKIRHDSHPYGG